MAVRPPVSDLLWMAILGCHMSIAGGFHEAVHRAADAGCDCLQIFTTPPRMWPKRANKKSGGGIADEGITQFQQSLHDRQIQAPIVHASYLINLASPDDGDPVGQHLCLRQVVRTDENRSTIAAQIGNGITHLLGAVRVHR